MTPATSIGGVTAALVVLFAGVAAEDSVAPKAPQYQRAYVVRVIDGDTLEVNRRLEKTAAGNRVRIVGIDTPERGECGYRNATIALVSYANGSIRLDTNPLGDRVDRYGRALRYVRDNRRDVGARLIQAGMAESYTRFPHPRRDLYNALEALARDRGIGLWAKTSCGHP